MKPLKSRKEFYDAVEHQEKVVVYWHTKWCPDCFAIKPHLPRLEQEFQHYQFFTMDRDIDIELARHLEIYGIPSFLVFKDGEEIGRYVDKHRKTYDQVKSFFEQTMK